MGVQQRSEVKQALKRCSNDGGRATGVAFAVGDATTAEVVGADLHQHLVASQLLMRNLVSACGAAGHW